MAKNILIFSDGTGQIGGLKPDQRLSNVYKMYRAMRPGPDSPINADEQYTFYDPGLGTDEGKGLTFRRTRATLSSAVGTGIDDNIADCYAAIIAHYEPGDRICLFGFSRGAYTVRSLANVLNLCGVPTHDSKDNPVPKHGPKLRKIANDAVRYVYNHGAGHDRNKFETEREEKARRFRKKYGSEGTGVDGEGQGNVQPTFIGVFDTVAALDSRVATTVVMLVFVGLSLATFLSVAYMPWLVTALVAFFTGSAFWWLISILFGQFKYFFKDPKRRLNLWNPLDWAAAFKNGHIARWSGKKYDWYVDREVRYLRHALSIDETRAKFPRVPWGRSKDYTWNMEQGHSDWLKQVWFAGNHSDIGGSYPEEESRLSDISLAWMVEELRTVLPDEIKIRDELLFTNPDPYGLQHDERESVLNLQPKWLRRITFDKLTWGLKQRAINDGASLHPSVLERFDTEHVPQMSEVDVYRPINLQKHSKVGYFFE